MSGDNGVAVASSVVFPDCPCMTYGRC
jgi:hypothetical protein